MKADSGTRLALVVWLVAAGLPVPADGAQPPTTQSALKTQDERERFLANAPIATAAPTDGRSSWRAALDDGTRRHDASVVTEDGSGPTGRNYKYNLAAYELDKLLGLNLVPTSVERIVADRPASVIWWIDDVVMSEVDRRRKKIDPPDRDGWDRQVQAVRVFDELISNTYRDPAPPLYLNSIWDNLLITGDWTVWITDHTGAFRTRHELQAADGLVRCPRSVLGRLRALNRPRLQQTLDRYLSSPQLDALEARRALLVRHFDQLIGTRGESAVLYDLPPRR